MSGGGCGGRKEGDARTGENWRGLIYLSCAGDVFGVLEELGIHQHVVAIF